MSDLILEWIEESTKLSDLKKIETCTDCDTSSECKESHLKIIRLNDPVCIKIPIQTWKSYLNNGRCLAVKGQCKKRFYTLIGCVSKKRWMFDNTFVPFRLLLTSSFTRNSRIRQNPTKGFRATESHLSEGGRPQCLQVNLQAHFTSDLVLVFRY